MSIANGVTARVLLAEDDAIIALDVEAILRDAGYTVLGPCSSVADSLSLLARGFPDAALIDVGLADGLAWPIAEMLANAAVPFALSTGEDDSDQDPAFCAGAIRLTKPYGGREIEAVLARLLDGRHATERG